MAAKEGAPHPVFTRTFQLAEIPAEATLVVTTDFSHARIFLNGRHVGTAEAFQSPPVLDVASVLKRGENVLRLDTERLSQAAAVAVRLECHVPENTGAIVSDRQWRWSSTTNGSLQPVQLRGPLHHAMRVPHRSEIAITELDDYTQWKQALGADDGADPSTFQVTDGFEIERVRSAGPDEGSWISLAFDPEGRLTIGREDQGLLRFTFDGKNVSSVETINDKLKECRGLVYAHGALYVNANESRGMYRLRDTTGDGTFDDVKLLRKFPGSSGHGRNNLTAEPDGRLYSIHGDAVKLPRDIGDRTSPFRDHRQGKKTREGHLVRTNPDGTKWEIIAAGLRNPFGVDFNEDGEAFTYDADAEHDMGAPWYRPTRLVHLVSGADYGWRGVTGSWPPYYPDHPDNGLPILTVGKGSPTSVRFGTKSNFPERYRRALFILDWAYGRILGVHMTPRGASYAARPEVFVKGRPFNVTGLDFGPDGAMYVVTGGRKTQSALYRISWRGKRSTAAIPESPQWEGRLKHARAARARRRRIEAAHGKTIEDEAGWERLWTDLADPDPWIAHAARVALEHQPLARWRDRAFSEKRTPARLQALMALAREPSGESSEAILAHLAGVDFNALRPSLQEIVLHTCRLCLSRGDVAERTRVKLRRVMADWRTCPGTQLKEQLLARRVSLGDPAATAASMRALRESDDPVQRLQYLFSLRNTTVGWTPPLRRAYLEALNGLYGTQGGAGMPKFLAQIREEFATTLSDEEKEELASLISAPARSQPTVKPIERKFVKKWTEDDIPSLVESTSKGDSEIGRSLFREVQCAACHRVGQTGNAVGPDLTSIARRFDRKSILLSIVAPSKVVDEQYRSDKVITSDGRVIVGRIVPGTDYRAETLRITPYPYDGSDDVTLKKAQIEEHSKSPLSVMPDGLLNTLSKQEVRHLLAFLESRGRLDRTSE